MPTAKIPFLDTNELIHPAQIPDLSSTYAPLASGGKFRGAVFLRADDSASPSSTAAINMKPFGDGAAASWYGYNDDSVGFILHFTGGSNHGTANAGLIGLGPNGINGLVVDNYGNQDGIDLRLQPGSSGLGLNAISYAPGTLAYLTHSDSAAVGHLMVLRGTAAASATTRVLSVRSTTDAEYIWIDNTLQLHVAAPSGHEQLWSLGSGVNQKMWVYSGSPGTFWYNAINTSTNELAIQQGTSNVAKGSETVTTLIKLKAGNKIALYNGTTPVLQATRVGQLTDSTTGTASATIGDVGTSFAQATLNNIHASLLAKINAIETRLSAAGGGIGITA